MTDSPWNPPTGPPNGVPLRSADARREVEEAIAAAVDTDQRLRSDLAAATTARVEAADRLEVVADEVEEARSLAKRALGRANESARAGQRDDAGKWTAAAQVFAMRLRDGRDALAELERRVAAETPRAEHARAALAANIGRLQAVAAARLPLLSGRKAAKLQREVDDAVAALATPTDDLVAAAARAAHAAVDEAAQQGAPVVVADDDLESEVDVDSTDDILAELRTELGLPAPPDDGAGSAADTADGPSGATPEPGAGPEATGGDRTDPPAAGSGSGAGSGAGSGSGAAAGGAGRRGTAGGGRSWPVPARR